MDEATIRQGEGGGWGEERRWVVRGTRGRSRYNTLLKTTYEYQ